MSNTLTKLNYTISLNPAWRQGDTRSVDVLGVISDHNTYKILKLVSMKQDGYTIEQLSKALELTKKQLYFRTKKLGKTGL
ncbi:MAG: hypothetical protein WB975_14250 [Nitrososphaeraceae archaeon]